MAKMLLQVILADGHRQVGHSHGVEHSLTLPIDAQLNWTGVRVPVEGEFVVNGVSFSNSSIIAAYFCSVHHI